MSLDAGRVGVRADQVDVHGRVTSPSFLNELLEDLPEWTDMPVWVNGTEELLPSNNSVPVTSPILADIAYPDIRRYNQYFTYRESPTPVDGLAKIKSIKGNTLVWNQLVQNGNFTNTSGWSGVRGTLSASNNILSYTVTELGGGGLQNRILRSVPIPAGHKVFVSISIKATKPFVFLADANGEFYLKNPITANEWNLCQAIRTISTGMENLVFGCPSTIGDMAVGDVIQFKDVMLVDLTKMGLDYITDPSDFTSLFSLPYYAYNQGTLLSFMGNGIKTTGKNLISNYYTNTAINNSGNRYSNNSALTTNEIFVFENRTLVASGTKQGDWFVHKFKNGVYAGYSSISNSVPFTLETGVTSIIVQYNNSNEGTVLPVQGMVEFGSTASEYEPYTTQTTSLPIATYFPTGMKSAGTVYDELTPTKGITRIGAVDLGTLSWTYSTDSQVFSSGAVLQRALTQNGICASYEKIDGWYDFNRSNKSIFLPTNSNIVRIKDSGYTDATAFKTAMNGVYLYYELATPVELPTLSLGE